MVPIAANLQGVKSLIDAAAARRTFESGLPVKLIAVSKSQTAVAVQTAFMAGQLAFGENYVQEGVAKIETLADLRHQGMEWHLIGPLQSNKAKLAATHFDWVQTIDRVRIAEALSRHRCGSLLNVCVQVNISGEPSKSGATPESAYDLVLATAQLPGLRLRGLMALIEDIADEQARRQQFQEMRALFTEIRRHLGDSSVFDTLSMGMSGDFSIAIEEGATLVRVGSAIFGART